MPASWWVQLCLFLLIERQCQLVCFGLSVTLEQHGFVFLSSLVFGVGCSALEPTASWVEPGLGEKMAASSRAHTNEYSPELPLQWSLSLQ